MTAFVWTPEAFDEAQLNVAMTVDMLQSVPPERMPSAATIAELFSKRENLSPEEHVVALCATIAVMFRLLAERP